MFFFLISLREEKNQHTLRNFQTLFAQSAKERLHRRLAMVIAYFLTGRHIFTNGSVRQFSRVGRDFRTPFDECTPGVPLEKCLSRDDNVARLIISIIQIFSFFFICDFQESTNWRIAFYTRLVAISILGARARTQSRDADVHDRRIL